MRKKSVTIKEVAREAGVSAQTVSRVLNERPDVSEDTRANILRIIASLGYSPNIIARSLIQGRSDTIGVAGYGLSYYGPSRILTGIERQANELGYSLVLSLLRQPEHDLGGDLFANLLSRKVDGIIWAVPEIGGNRPTLIAQAEAASIPVVFINMEPREGLSFVSMDNLTGARRAVEHLIDKGYRRIGIITGPEAWWESAQREGGWRAALTATGRYSERDLDGLRVVGDWHPASGEAGLTRLLTEQPSLDAVFCCNDPMALGALQAARKLGRFVPADLAIVGYDDIPEAAFFFPPLTTVRQPLAEMGAEAVQMIHRALTHPEDGEPYPSEQVWLRPELVVRASSLKPV